MQPMPTNRAIPFIAVCMHELPPCMAVLAEPCPSFPTYPCCFTCFTCFSYEQDCHAAWRVPVRVRERETTTIAASCCIETPTVYMRGPVIAGNLSLHFLTPRPEPLAIYPLIRFQMNSIPPSYPKPRLTNSNRVSS